MTQNKLKPLRIGCAGWNVQKEFRDPGKSHLKRYSEIFNCVEINSSFYRHHQPKTYAKWAESAGPEFKFSIKIPKTITHERQPVIPIAKQLAGEICELGNRLGPLLVQFPPKAEFSKEFATSVFGELQEKIDAEIVCEPRHESWFKSSALKTLEKYKVSLVAADPHPLKSAGTVFDSIASTYYRLHGSPKKYYSSYSDEFLKELKSHTDKVYKSSRKIWVVFDNTASGHAFGNARTLADL